ncbi:MAG: hypothetical protein K0R73_1400 [Candidatus Midichloriaceae bacterium]|jgi:uncharacterized phiE125 gp8 family phage protein|nr:hypothetical protein [Candidatus Midichloriaceae bacterium]
MSLTYTLNRLKKPARLPLSIEEVKKYLKIDFSEDDELLLTMIAAATQRFESYTSRALIAQTCQVVYKQLARISVTLPIRPVIKITGIQLVELDGSLNEFSLKDVELDAAMSELYFHTFAFAHLVKIQYIAGYGYSPEYIPADIKAVLLNHIGYMYEARSVTAIYPLALYDEFKLMRL